MFTELEPAPRGEPQGVRVSVHGKGELPGARKVLALIELDDESRVGNPVVTARQHVASDERADAVSPISLQNPHYVSQCQID